MRVALRGAYCPNAKTAGISNFLTGVWLRGTESRSNADLARSIEGLAADIDGYAGRSSIGVTLDVPTSTFEPALGILADVLLAPAFDPEEIEHERHDLLASLARREDRLGERSFDLFLATLFEHHPFRHPVIGTKHGVQRIDRVALKRISASAADA